MKKYYIAFIVLLLITSSLNSHNQEFESFWKIFQTALAEGEEDKIIEMTYFASDEEKEYFSFSLSFDSEAIIAITQTKAKDLTIFTDKNADYDVNPFEILVLPEEINQLFLLHVNYEDDSVDEPYSYQRVYAFGKYKGEYKFLGFFSIG